MNHIFQLTLYTGQQLVLEGLQRWMRKPCADDANPRQRRTSLKGLVILLLKTAATGVLATILDAAIEYRRRQLLLVAQEEPSSSATDASRFPSLGVLSRAGIAAWKTRLLHAIDEMERHAEQYGIEPTHRFAPLPAADQQDDKGKEPLTVPDDADTNNNTSSERKAELSRTVEQLRDLVKQGNEELLEERVDALLDTLLGPEHLTPAPILVKAHRGSALVRGRSSAHLHASSSSANVAALDPSTPTGSDGVCVECSPAGSEACDFVCHICMDREVRVKVVGCNHDLCFQCARRLCASADHAMPQCPFCRQTINGFESWGAVRA